MKKRIISLTVLIIMMMMVVMPTIVFATNDENTIETNTLIEEVTNSMNEVDTDIVDENITEGDEVDDEIILDEDITEDDEMLSTNLITSIEQVELNRKIKFTGNFYQNKMFGFIDKLIGRESEDVVEKTDQIAIVTDVLLRKKDGMIGVGFIEEGKKIPTTGYIKFEECNVEEVGEYIVFEFNIEDGATLTITVDGEVYNVDAGGNVAMTDSGIVIDGNVILLDKESNVQLATAGGDVTVDIQNLSFNAGGNVGVYDDALTVGGNATMQVIDNGVSVSGDVLLNGSEIGSGNGSIQLVGDAVAVGGSAQVSGTEIGAGTAEITLDKENIIGIEITNANVAGMDITDMANSVVQKIIELIKNLISSLLSRIFK